MPNIYASLPKCFSTMVFGLFLIVFVACKSEPVSSNDLFHANFHPFPNVLVDLEQDSLGANPKVLTFLSYRKKDYREALRYSNKIKPLSEIDPIQLYRGVCFMAMSRFAEAVAILTPISEGNIEYKDAANWYLALCALKEGNISTAKIYLKKLTNRSTYIRNEAQVLLKKVENLHASN